MIGMTIAFVVGYVLARNQEKLLGLLKSKVEKDLLPPNDQAPRP